MIIAARARKMVHQSGRKRVRDESLDRNGAGSCLHCVCHRRRYDVHGVGSAARDTGSEGGGSLRVSVGEMRFKDQVAALGPPQVDEGTLEGREV